MTWINFGEDARRCQRCFGSALSIEREVYCGLSVCEDHQRGSGEVIELQLIEITLERRANGEGSGG